MNKNSLLDIFLNRACDDVQRAAQEQEELRRHEAIGIQRPCVKCKHYAYESLHQDRARDTPEQCMRVVGTIERVDVVTGEKRVDEYHGGSCYSARGKYAACGVEGKFWEPRS